MDADLHVLFNASFSLVAMLGVPSSLLVSEMDER